MSRSQLYLQVLEETVIRTLETILVQQLWSADVQNIPTGQILPETLKLAVIDFTVLGFTYVYQKIDHMQIMEMLLICSIKLGYSQLAAVLEKLCVSSNGERA